MTDKEALIAARSLISDAKHWTQAAYYRDAEGDMNGAIESATCFCAVGALFRVAGMPVSEPDILVPGAKILRRVLAEILSEEDDSMQVVFNFNDTHEHGDILRLFDKAILLAE